MLTEELPEVLRPLAPKIGSVWIWEPLKSHARERTTVTAVRWNGEEAWVESTGERDVQCFQRTQPMDAVRSA